MSQPTLHSAHLFLYNMALADAYGAGFEFKPQQFVDKKNNLQTYFKHGKDNIPLGHYTDDTQMTLALCNLMLSGDTIAPFYIANHFVEAYKDDPRLGYAGGFQRFLQSCENGQDFLSKIKPNSTKNGAAMRAIPCGFLPELEDVLYLAGAQAKVTHNTKEGIASAKAIAILAYVLYHSGVQLHNSRRASGVQAHYLIIQTALLQMQKQNLGFNFSNTHTGRVNCDGIQTVQAVFTVLKQHNNLADILKASVAFGGDTDSVAALAVGLASLSPYFKQNLPTFLVNGFESESEDGAFGADYLQYIGEELAIKHPSRKL